MSNYTVEKDYRASARWLVIRQDPYAVLHLATSKKAGATWIRENTPETRWPDPHTTPAPTAQQPPTDAEGEEAR